MPTMRHMRIFMSFHHICLRTRLAPLRKPWADTARLSVLSCSESRRAPRSETLLMLSRMMPTVLSISWDTSQHELTHDLNFFEPLLCACTYVFTCAQSQWEGATRVRSSLVTIASLTQALCRPLRLDHRCLARMRQTTQRSTRTQKKKKNIPLGAQLCGGCHSGPGRPAGHRRRRWECRDRTGALRGSTWLEMECAGDSG